jgi:excisionase family DNA binding protein
MAYITAMNVNRTAPLLTVSEAAAFLHVHTNTLRRWSNDGLLMSYRISSRGDRRFLREDLISFLHSYSANEENQQQY